MMKECTISAKSLSTAVAPENHRSLSADAKADIESGPRFLIYAEYGSASDCHA